MISFGLYLLSFAANTLVVLTAPAGLLRGYVLVYNAASVVFSLSSFAYFSRLATTRRSIGVVACFAVGMVAVAFAAGWYEACLWAYPGLLILSDYLVTQSHGIRVVTGFRLLMIVSSIPFIVAPQMFTTSLALRVVLLQIVSIALVTTAKESHLLAVRSPVRYQIGNYLFYNGTLSLLALLVRSADLLRWWYLATQIALVLVLKVLDYSLRRAYSLDARTRYTALIAAGSVPLIAFFVHPALMPLCLAYTGFFGLIWTGRYISR